MEIGPYTFDFSVVITDALPRTTNALALASVRRRQTQSQTQQISGNSSHSASCLSRIGRPHPPAGSGTGAEDVLPLSRHVIASTSAPLGARITRPGASSAQHQSLMANRFGSRVQIARV